MKSRAVATCTWYPRYAGTTDGPSRLYVMALGIGDEKPADMRRDVRHLCDEREEEEGKIGQLDLRKKKSFRTSEVDMECRGSALIKQPPETQKARSSTFPSNPPLSR